MTAHDIALDPMAGTLAEIARARVSQARGEAIADELVLPHSPVQKIAQNAAIRVGEVNRNLLALDLGTKLGWAYAGRDGTRICGTEDFTPRASWHPGQRFTRFRAWLSQFLAQRQVHAVAYERVIQGPHRSGAAGDIYGAIWGQMLVCTEAHNIVPQAVHTMTVKKHVAGDGRADKAAVIAAIEARGWRPDSDNAADAAAILELALWAERTGANITPARTKRRPKKERTSC